MPISDGAARGGPRAIRGQSAGDPRRAAGEPRRAETRAGFRAVLPACAPAVNSRKHRTGSSLFEARPENEHGAQAPRAVSNQGFEGSKCYILIRSRIVGQVVPMQVKFRRSVVEAAPTRSPFTLSNPSDVCRCICVWVCVGMCMYMYVRLCVYV